MKRGGLYFILIVFFCIFAIGCGKKLEPTPKADKIISGEVTK